MKSQYANNNEDMRHETKLNWQSILYIIKKQINIYI
jgi:hypothetical protein